MKILILTATELEARPLKEKLKPIIEKDVRIERFLYGGITIDVLVSGIGMVAKAYQLGRYLQKGKYDLALNVGIAGSFNKETPIGSVVNVVQDRFAEMGAQDGDDFIGIAEMNFEEFKTYPYTNGILRNGTDFGKFGLDDMKKANGITANTIHGKHETISRITKKFNPDIETMGGAAFLFVCMSEKIPCAQIRSISNYVEVRDRLKWKVPLAIAQLTQEVMKVIENINRKG
ncbi:MAG: futalosine hydrolase [Bacteroidetes bacterium 4572_114]|nr:MAG: futalosine hydrolase [Bacteroidetes bacterium 4572_114]